MLPGPITAIYGAVVFFPRSHSSIKDTSDLTFVAYISFYLSIDW